MIESGMPATAVARAATDPVELVRRQVQARPGRDAIVEIAGDRRTTVGYAELGRRADELAARLRRLPVGPGEPVAVLVGSSTDTVVAMLAVLSAGGAYCPIDRGAPDLRIAAIVAALRARTAVVDAPNAGRLPPGVQALDIAASAADPGTASGPVGPDPAATAYVLHTSGSTGTPKGVAMGRSGLARLIAWQAADGPPGLRTLQFTATSFDVVFQEVLSTLATGGCLVTVPDEARRDPATLLEIIDREGVERLFLPYVALQMLADAARRRGTVPGSLRHVVTAGERLVVTPAIRELFAALPGCRLDNHYGPTEAHLVTSHTLPDDPAAWPVAPPVGAPVDGVACWLLDQRLQPVPDGTTGELYVAGSGLARGYLHEHARTAERFVAHPFGAPGERLYRTGDLVRRAADGTHEFVGRADGQLKVRGFRVEPAEVEHALLEHPQVVAAAVGLRELADGIPALVAYLQTDGVPTHREIVDHVRDVLPPYMIPARTVLLDTLPRTASGKVDAAALAATELPDSGVEPATPDGAATDLPAVISTVWARVLGHDEFTHDDDFFDVGGDSLLATWVVAELSQALGQPVELSLLLEYSTVEDLAVALAGAAGTVEMAPASPSQITTLRPGPSGRVLYLMHPLGGELIGYRELARASRAPLRLLGVGWSGTAPAVGTPLPDIAAVHVDQIRTVQPDGPYLLAGWSFGGVLAYEVAQQLVAGGADLAFLGLIDANPVLDPITGLPLGETAFLGLLDAVAARLDDPAGPELAELTTSQTWVQLMGAPMSGAASPAYLRGVVATARACMRAAMDYRPRPYPARVHLYQATAAGAEHQERLGRALTDLVGGSVAATPVPGDHWGLMRAGAVDRLAELLDAALEGAAEMRSGT
jgi:amino acid adenylation domain-containing protein